MRSQNLLYQKHRFRGNMSAYSSQNRTEKSAKQETRIDGTGLYFNNNGLFSENYLLYRLPDEKNDSFILEHWETEALPAFSECYEWMLSTWDEYKDIYKTLDEAQLEDKWIRPILKRLGWTYEVQDRLKKRGKTQIPDYSLFKDDKAYIQGKSAKTDEAYFKHVLAVADAKAMGINLDGAGRTNSNPSYQIIRYMEDTGKTWGILTDGEYWRLYSLNSESKFTTYFEVNIRKALAQRDDERFKYFFNFFRKESFLPKTANGQSFLDVVYRSGEQYAKEVEIQLKKRAFHIAQSICKGFATQYPNLKESDYSEIYDHSLFLLFRLMFILNSEAKGIFDVNDLSDYFPSSLRSLAIDLKNDFEIGRKWSDQTKTYSHLLNLMNLIQQGDSKLNVTSLGSEVFSSGAKGYFKSHQISDAILNPAIVELACAYDEDNNLKFIDYKRLSPDHLGSLFEGLLDYKLTKASEKLVDDGGEIKSWTEISLKKQEKLKGWVIAKGEMYLESGSGSRKDTGSYYTPSYIVDYIVAKVLGPLCDGKSAKEILQIKVCDPAMGSGHFLIGTIKYLEEKVLDAIYRDEKNPELNREDVRWEILHNCIFGVDLNPLAVELSKFSLWMYTVRRGQELEMLSDQLLAADSLLHQKKINSQFKLKNGFHGIVGNPPYVNTFLLERILEKNPSYKEDIKANLKSAKGAFDICSLFVEVARAIGPNARIGYILPNKLVAVDSAKGMREFIREDSATYLESIDDISNVPIFEDAAVYPIVLCLSDKRPKSVAIRKHLVKFDPELAWSERDFPVEAGEKFLANLLDNSGVGSYESIPLGKEFEILSAATVDEAYKAIKPNITSKKPRSGVKFAVSGNIVSFGCTWEAQKVQYLKSTYIKPYLDLSSSKIIDKRKQQYGKNKLIIPNMTQMLRAYFDKGEIAPGISTTMIFGRPDDLKAVGAYLNSKTATKVYAGMFESLHLNGGALRVGTPQLAELPIPVSVLTDGKTKESLIAFYDRISALVGKLLTGDLKGTVIRKILDRQEIKPELLKGNISLKALKDSMDQLDEFCDGLVSQRRQSKKAAAR